MLNEFASLKENNDNFNRQIKQNSNESFGAMYSNEKSWSRDADDKRRQFKSDEMAWELRNEND